MLAISTSWQSVDRNGRRNARGADKTVSITGIELSYQHLAASLSADDEGALQRFGLESCERP